MDDHGRGLAFDLSTLSRRGVQEAAKKRKVKFTRVGPSLLRLPVHPISEGFVT